MERDVWDALCQRMRKQRDRRPAKCQFTDHDIVRVFLWATLHDRPVSWACRPDAWPRRPRSLPTPSTMTRRLRTLSVMTTLRRLAPRPRVRSLVCVDGKPLTVSRFSKDRQASYGYAVGGMGRGYKLHAACDSRGNLLAFDVRPINEAECMVARPADRRAGVCRVGGPGGRVVRLEPAARGRGEARSDAAGAASQARSGAGASPAGAGSSAVDRGARGGWTQTAAGRAAARERGTLLRVADGDRGRQPAGVGPHTAAHPTLDHRQARHTQRTKRAVMQKAADGERAGVRCYLLSTSIPSLNPSRYPSPMPHLPATIIVCLLPAVALAQPEPVPPIAADSPPSWTASADLNLWRPALQDEIALPGGALFRLETINLDENEIVPTLRTVFSNNDWNFELSGFIFETEGSNATTSGEVDYASIEFLATTNIWSRELSDQVSLRLDAGGGLRASDMDIELTTGATTTSDDSVWIEALGAARLTVELPSDFGFEIHTELGGGLSSTTASIGARTRWNPEPYLSVHFGYRFLATNLDDDDFRYEGALAGLYVGASIEF